jgi:hypothetical protein
VQIASGALATLLVLGAFGCEDGERPADPRRAADGSSTRDAHEAGTPPDEPGLPGWAASLPAVGPDCLTLARAAAPAVPCEPALEEVLHALLRRPDEAACREAARALLETAQALSGSPSSAGPSPASLVAIDETLRERPLSDDEQRALRSLPLPGVVRVRPDAAPAPGVPSVDVWLDGARVIGDDAGVVERRLATGPHELTLFHAGHRSTSCLTLERCVTVELVAQGHVPSMHPAVRRTPCR